MDKNAVLLATGMLVAAMTIVPPVAAEVPDWADYAFPWVQPDEEGDEPIWFLDIESFSATTLDEGQLFFAIELHDLTGASGNLAHNVFFSVGGEDYQLPLIATWAGGNIVEQLPLSWTGAGTNVLQGWEVLPGEDLIVLEANVDAITGLEPGTPLEDIVVDTRVVTALGHVRDTATPSEPPLDYPYGLGSNLYAPEGDEETVIEETIEGERFGVEHAFTEATNMTYRYNWTTGEAGPWETVVNASLEKGTVNLTMVDGSNETVLNESFDGDVSDSMILNDAVSGDWVIEIVFTDVLGTFNLTLSVYEEAPDPGDHSQDGDTENGDDSEVNGNQTQGNATAEERGFLPVAGTPIVVTGVIALVALVSRRRHLPSSEPAA